MKNFTRENQLFSLCGLNCSLCSMNLGGYCPGCGGGPGNQACAIARCSIKHGNLQYCVECKEYPCVYYDGITEYDSFIVHRNQLNDLEKFKQIGVEKYNQEQIEKRQILDCLLENYNNGRKKNFFCIAVNLLDLESLKGVITDIETDQSFVALDDKEKIMQITTMIENIAGSKGIVLKLRKKK